MYRLTIFELIQFAWIVKSNKRSDELMSNKNRLMDEMDGKVVDNWLNTIYLRVFFFIGVVFFNAK